MAEDEIRDDEGGGNALKDFAEKSAARSAERRGREKLTGEALGQQMRERREARELKARKKAAAKPTFEESQAGLGRGRKLFRGLVVGGLALGLLGSAVVLNGVRGDAAEAQANNEAQIRTLESEIAELQKVVEDSDPADFAKQVAERTEAARVAGDEMSALQNQSNAAVRTAGLAQQGQVGNGGGTLDPKVLEARKAVAERFDKSALPLDDAIAYSSASNTGLEETDVDPRFAWFTKSEATDKGLVAADAAGYSWRVETMMPVSDSADSFRLMWSNLNADGTLYAWAKAVYNVEAGTFSDFELTTTIAGDNVTAGKGL